MLQIRGLSRQFGEVTALDGIDLEVATGETVALIGASGCGKSTLLRSIVGLVVPDAGAITLDGEPLVEVGPTGARSPSDPTWRHRLGYVIQEGGLFPHLDARGNLALQARTVGWSEERIDARIVELFELTRLEAAHLERFPAQLSGGQRQRIGLVRALMLDPAVLLLDEPLGALDPLIRADLQRDLRTIFERLGKTVVLVTHDLAEARFLAHRLVLMDAGRVVQQGRFEDLVKRPADARVQRFVAAQRTLHLENAGEEAAE
ncbi:MAG: ATP-binding cassette domain-containing protein [Acidobacteriota bacterium]